MLPAAPGPCLAHTDVVQMPALLAGMGGGVAPVPS